MTGSDTRRRTWGLALGATAMLLVFTGVAYNNSATGERRLESAIPAAVHAKEHHAKEQVEFIVSSELSSSIITGAGLIQEVETTSAGIIQEVVEARVRGYDRKLKGKKASKGTSKKGAKKSKKGKKGGSKKGAESIMPSGLGETGQPTITPSPTITPRPTRTPTLPTLSPGNGGGGNIPFPTGTPTGNPTSTPYPTAPTASPKPSDGGESIMPSGGSKKGSKKGKKGASKKGAKASKGKKGKKRALREQPRNFKTGIRRV